MEKVKKNWIWWIREVTRLTKLLEGDLSAIEKVEARKALRHAVKVEGAKLAQTKARFGS